MAEINSLNASTRKRKLSSKESVIEIIDKDDGVEISSQPQDVEIVEPDEKITHFDTVPSQSSDSNLEFGSLNSQSSTEVEILSEEPVHDVKQRLLELDDEVRLLRAENEELRLSSHKRPRNTELESVLSITFSNNENFQLYKDKLMKFFESSPELCVTVEEASLLLDVAKDHDIDPEEWVIIDEVDWKKIPTFSEGSAPKKKKKKDNKPDVPVVNDLFTLDTTPSISTKGSSLCYESKFTVLSEDDKGAQTEVKVNKLATCFNCNDSHNLRDCPKPKNFMKINAARQKFKSQQTRTVRYHLEDDQRFGHLHPGKLSEKLQRALGLRENELPPYIYQMRRLGYPPGWFHEIQAAYQSELVMFDFEGKSEFKQRKQAEDSYEEKIIEYPGFNAPMEKGVKDEYRLYGCPSYSKEVSKHSMLEFIRGIKKKAEDNLETCDMDIDNAPSDREAELIKSPINKPSTNPEIKDEEGKPLSPSLIELESQKQQLLAALTQNTSCPAEGLDETKQNDESVGEAYRTIDITGTVDELNQTAAEIQENGAHDCSVSSPVRNVVKTSSFGTPILKSSTPYCRLPNPINFSQNVSEVINFENLPNSTGKYEQMIGVLDKVRKTLKNLNDQKS